MSATRMRSKPPRTSSAETAARYHQARHADAKLKLTPTQRASRGYRGTPHSAVPAYATDGIAIPRRKRRVLLDLAPDTVSALLDCVRRTMAGQPSFLERILVEALERAR